MTVDWLIPVETLRALCGGVLVVVVVITAVVDYREMILPDRLNVALAATGLGQAVLVEKPGLIDAMLGALFAFAVLWSVARLFRHYRGIDGLGFGDVKFSAAAGVWIGWEGVAPMLLIASCSALVFVAFRSWTRQRFEPTTRLPFGPFLGLGTAGCWLLAALPQPWV
jgi:leader peptidase (prepilin peptidase) / N-methyltransferase